MDEDRRLTVVIEPQKRQKFKVACLNQGVDMATVLRKFIAKFIRDPKKMIDFINS